MPKRGQVAGHQVEQPCHGGGAGEPENGDGAQVVHRPENVTQVLVCQEGQGPAVGLAAGFELGGRDQERGDETGRDEEPAHDQGSCGQELVRAADPAGRIGLRVVRAALDLRHDGHSRFKAGEPEGEFGEDQQGDADHHQGVTVLLVEGGPPVRDHVGFAEHMREAHQHHHQIQQEEHGHQDNGHVDGFLEAAEEDDAQAGDQGQSDGHFLAVQEVGGKRVFNGVGTGIRGRERNGDHEVRGCETQERKDEQFAAPPGKEPFQHRDGALPAGTFRSNPAVHRQGAEERNDDQHDGGQGRDHPGGKRGNGGLIAKGGEVVDAGKAHDLPPGLGCVICLWLAVGPLPFAGSFGHSLQEPAP